MTVTLMIGLRHGNRLYFSDLSTSIMKPVTTIRLVISMQSDKPHTAIGIRASSFVTISKLLALVGLSSLLGTPVYADSQELATLTAPAASAVAGQPQRQKPLTIYQGRSKPELIRSPDDRLVDQHILGASAGYYADYRHPPHGAGDKQRSNQRSGISAHIYYQAPSTTVINRRIEVIAPQNPSSNVYFNHDTYYIYPAATGAYYPGQRYIPPVIPVTIDRQATENRAKQWTDKADFNP